MSQSKTSRWADSDTDSDVDSTPGHGHGHDHDGTTITASTTTATHIGRMNHHTKEQEVEREAENTFPRTKTRMNSDRSDSSHTWTTKDSRNRNVHSQQHSMVLPDVAPSKPIAGQHPRQSTQRTYSSQQQQQQQLPQRQSTSGTSVSWKEMALESQRYGTINRVPPMSANTNTDTDTTAVMSTTRHILTGSARVGIHVNPNPKDSMEPVVNGSEWMAQRQSYQRQKQEELQKKQKEEELQHVQELKMKHKSQFHALKDFLQVNQQERNQKQDHRSMKSTCVTQDYHVERILTRPQPSPSLSVSVSVESSQQTQNQSRMQSQNQGVDSNTHLTQQKTNVSASSSLSSSSLQKQSSLIAVPSSTLIPSSSTVSTHLHQKNDLTTKVTQQMSQVSLSESSHMDIKREQDKIHARNLTSTGMTTVVSSNDDVATSLARVATSRNSTSITSHTVIPPNDAKSHPTREKDYGNDVNHTNDHDSHSDKGRSKKNRRKGQRQKTTQHVIASFIVDYEESEVSGKNTTSQDKVSDQEVERKDDTIPIQEQYTEDQEDQKVSHSYPNINRGKRNTKNKKETSATFQTLPFHKEEDHSITTEENKTQNGDTNIRSKNQHTMETKKLNDTKCFVDTKPEEHTSTTKDSSKHHVIQNVTSDPMEPFAKDRKHETIHSSFTVSSMNHSLNSVRTNKHQEVQGKLMADGTVHLFRSSDKSIPKQKWTEPRTQEVTVPSSSLSMAASLLHPKDESSADPNVQQHVHEKNHGRRMRTKNSDPRNGGQQLKKSSSVDHHSGGQL